MKYADRGGVIVEERVAPHWGAWIEIILLVEVQHDSRSHPTGVRGLKLQGTP